MLKNCINYLADITIKLLPAILEKIVAESGDNCSSRLIPTIDINEFFMIHTKESLEVYFYILFELMKNNKSPKEIKDFTSNIGYKITNIAESGYGEKEELTPESIEELISYICDMFKPSAPVVERNLTPAPNIDLQDKETEIINLKKELDKIKEKCKENQDLQDKFEKFRVEKENEISNIKEECTKKNDENQKLNAKLKKNRSDYEAKIELLSKEIQQKNEEIQQKNEEIQQKNEEIQQKDTEIKQKNEEIQQKDTEIQQKDTEIQQKDTEINSLKGKHGKAQQLIKDWQKKVDDKERECNKKIAAKKKEFNETITAKETECEQKILDMETECNKTIETEKGNCKQEIDNLNAKYDQIDKENKKRSDEFEKLRNDFSKKDREFQEQKEEYIKFMGFQNNEFEKMKKNLDKSINENRKLKAKNDNYENQFHQLQNHMKGMKTQYDEMVSKYKYIKDENNKLKSENKKLKASIEIPDIHSINESYSANDDLESLENELNSLIKSKQDLTPRDTTINNEMRNILMLFHQLMSNFNKNVPKKFAEFIQDLQQCDGNEKIEKIKKYVDECIKH